jgi:hypothetical protein
MVTPEREDSCIIEWNPQVLNLDDLVVFTSYLADLYAEVAAPYVTAEFRQLFQSQGVLVSPRVSYIRMNSPLIAELVSDPGGGLGVLALGMVAYMIKHPETLGGWISRLRRASYRDRILALEEKDRYLRTKAAIEVESRAIERFEVAVREAPGSPGEAPGSPGEAPGSPGEAPRFTRGSPPVHQGKPPGSPGQGPGSPGQGF